MEDRPHARRRATTAAHASVKSAFASQAIREMPAKRVNTLFCPFCNSGSVS